MNAVYLLKQSYVARISTIRRRLWSLDFLSFRFPRLGSLSLTLFTIISVASYLDVRSLSLQNFRRNAILMDMQSSIASNHLSPESFASGICLRQPNLSLQLWKASVTTGASSQFKCKHERYIFPLTQKTESYTVGEETNLMPRLFFLSYKALQQ